MRPRSGTRRSPSPTELSQARASIGLRRGEYLLLARWSPQKTVRIVWRLSGIASWCGCRHPWAVEAPPPGAEQSGGCRPKQEADLRKVRTTGQIVIRPDEKPREPRGFHCL